MHERYLRRSSAANSCSGPRSSGRHSRARSPRGFDAVAQRPRLPNPRFLLTGFAGSRSARRWVVPVVAAGVRWRQVTESHFGRGFCLGGEQRRLLGMRCPVRVEDPWRVAARACWPADGVGGGPGRRSLVAAAGWWRFQSVGGASAVEAPRLVRRRSAAGEAGGLRCARAALRPDPGGEVAGRWREGCRRGAVPARCRRWSPVVVSPGSGALWWKPQGPRLWVLTQQAIPADGSLRLPQQNGRTLGELGPRGRAVRRCRVASLPSPGRCRNRRGHRPRW